MMHKNAGMYRNKSVFGLLIPSQNLMHASRTQYSYNKITYYRGNEIGYIYSFEGHHTIIVWSIIISIWNPYSFRINTLHLHNI